MMPIRELPMTDPRPGNKPVDQSGSIARSQSEPLLSDEPTIELVIKARGGDRMAVEALLQRCLPSLRRWTHGRLPAAARANLDTEDSSRKRRCTSSDAWTSSSRSMSGRCRHTFANP